MTNVTTGVIAIMKADPALNTLVSGRIYGAELPESENGNMPEKAIVIALSGGIEDSGTIEIMKSRVDVYCYGETFYQAGIVDAQVYELLKYAHRETISNMLIHEIAVSGGAIQLKESKSEAPIMWRSYVVTASEITI